MGQGNDSTGLPETFDELHESVTHVLRCDDVAWGVALLGNIHPIPKGCIRGGSLFHEFCVACAADESQHHTDRAIVAAAAVEPVGPTSVVVVARW